MAAMNCTPLEMFVEHGGSLGYEAPHSAEHAVVVPDGYEPDSDALNAVSYSEAGDNLFVIEPDHGIEVLEFQNPESGHIINAVLTSFG